MTLATTGDHTLKFWHAAADREIRAQPTYEPPGE